MNEMQTVFYGGSYREEWKDNYHLTVVYENQKMLTLRFSNGAWHPADGRLPALPLAELYFRQAADAAVASRRFLASGLTAQDLTALAPSGEGGPIFAAECLRILMDDCGQKMETVYPYLLPCMGEPLPQNGMAALGMLQGRSLALLRQLLQLQQSVPSVRHDLRLPEYRSPFGAVRTGENLTLQIRVQPNRLIAAVLEVFGDSFQQEHLMEKTEDGWRVAFTAPDEEAALWYRFRLETGEQVFWLGPASDGIHAWLRNSAQDGFRLTVYRRDFETPAWFQNGVMYQVFPDRFAFTDDGTAEAGIRYHKALGQHPDLHASRREEVRWQPRSFEKDYIPDDFYGGTLRGIREKLPYLKELGISCLYLNPIVEARSNHRYDTSDYLKVDPILGDTEDFRDLCRAAGEYGIRILCDGVFSHTGADSIYFNRDGHYPGDGACQNQQSPYYSWYDFHRYPDEYRSWWGFEELPEVDENDPSWQDYVVTGKDSVIRQWLRRGASGWRIDVADELPDNVLCLIRQAAREEKRDSVILGEVWEDAVLKESYGSRRKYALGGALDSVMNYPFRTAVLDFLHERMDAFSLASFLTGQQLHYPQPLYVCLMNLLGSHDTERLYTTLATDQPLKDFPREMQRLIERGIPDSAYRRAEKLEKLALTLQFSVPGVPSIYYGDELGMTGVNDPFNRRPMEEAPGFHTQWLLPYLRELSAFRSTHRAFREGDAFFLANDPDVLLILRSLKEEAVLTVVNRAGTKRRFRLEAQGHKAEGLIEARSASIIVLSENKDGCKKPAAAEK